MNFLKNGLRNLKSHPFVVIANIAGLTIGFVSCLYIFSFIKQESSFDKFHPNHNRIYRVVTNWIFDNAETSNDLATVSVAPYMKERYPFIENTVRFQIRGPVVIQKGDDLFEEKAILYVDSTIFDVFNFKLLQGNEKYALTQPRSIVFTESMAIKYYGLDWKEQNMIGDTFIYNFRDTYQITGVVEDPPANSTIQFNFLESFSSISDARVNSRNGWAFSGYSTFVLFSRDSDIDFVLNEMPFEPGFTDVKGYSAKLYMEPFTETYLSRSFGNPMGPKGSSDLINLFTGIGILIILLACINYISLSTAMSSYRAKEISIKKIMGSGRSRIIRQNMMETILQTYIALFIAYGVSYALFPLINIISGKELSFDLLLNPTSLVAIFIAVLLVGILSGLYPAFQLAGKLPVSLLADTSGASSKGRSLRKVLTIFQFMMVIILIGFTLIITNQVEFMFSKDLGYDRTNIVRVPINFYKDYGKDIFKRELDRLPFVESAAFVQDPINEITFSTLYKIPGRSGKIHMMTNKVGDEFVNTMGLEIVDGRDFRKLLPDSGNFEFILNESALKLLDWNTEKAIGVNIIMNWGVRGDFEGPVVGVVKDFHFKSLHEPLEPLVLVNDNGTVEANLLIRLTENDLPFKITSIGNLWAQHITNYPWDYEFLEDQIESTYGNEVRTSHLIQIFLVVVICLAVIGLLGLCIYSSAIRTKEIGIRKVFGATSDSILKLFLIDYIKLVAISALPAWSIGFYFSNLWLRQFAYHIGVNPLIFLVSTVLVLIMTFITVGYQSFKSSITSPSVTLTHRSR